MTTLKELKNILPEKLFGEVNEKLKNSKLSTVQKKKVVKKVLELYNKSCSEPGESQGVISAQSLSEPSTQMTMRTYHLAGAGEIKVTLGLPRLIEIFDARRSPSTPSMIIYLKRSYNSKEHALKVSAKIKELKLGDITENCSIDLLNNQVEVFLNEKEMKTGKVNMNLIYKLLTEAFPKVNVKKRKDSFALKPKDEANIKDLQKLKTKTLEVILSGIKGISQTIINQKGSEWVLNTLGTNLSDVLEKIKEVDIKRTLSNNIHEVQKVLGIEAARGIIINEVYNILENQGLDVDIRHIMLVADVMTADGAIKAIGRYGVAGSKGSVLARANFEETVKHLTRAAVSGEKDNLESVVENVMINRVVPAGTGMVDLVYRPKKEK